MMPNDLSVLIAPHALNASKYGGLA
jgi:hypothetical protein